MVKFHVKKCFKTYVESFKYLSSRMGLEALSLSGLLFSQIKVPRSSRLCNQLLEVLVVEVEQINQEIVVQQETHLQQVQHKEQLEDEVDLVMQVVVVVELLIRDQILVEDLVAVVEMEGLQKLLVQQLSELVVEVVVLIKVDQLQEVQAQEDKQDQVVVVKVEMDNLWEYQLQDLMVL